MKIFLLALALVGIAFALIGIKMFLIKGGTFSKSCSSVDEGSGEHIGCTCGEKSPEERCENYEEHHGAEATAKKIREIPVDILNLNKK
jgi:hypothetical protein